MTGRQLLAEFATEASLCDAVRAARAVGFVVADVYSPYPLASLEEVSGAGRSIIARAGLVGGVFGGSGGLALQAWTSAVSWPLDVGGRDPLPWLAFIPVTFELTVLGAAVAAVAALLVGLRVRRRTLPDVLRGTETGRRFVVVLEVARVELLGPAHALMRAMGSSCTLDASIDRPEALDRVRSAPERWAVFNRAFLLVALAAMSLAAVLWSVSARRASTVAVAMQAPGSQAADLAAPRGTAPGAVPREALPMRYQATEADALRAGVELQMPAGVLAEEPTGPAALFRTFCQPCHGDDGHGDGLTMKRGFQPPPSLLTQRARDMKDGQMFHVITYGQKLMPSHAAQVPVDDRWRLIRHIRGLQRRLPTDPPPFGDPATSGSVAPR